MVNHSLHTTDLRLQLPETLWLEPEYFEQARAISTLAGNRLQDESQQWQTYLNVLGMLSFEAWLRERLPICYPIQHNTHELVNSCYLRVGDFQLCLIATEQMLDEIVRVPKLVIEQPDLAAHFYVVLEVLEEQEQAIVRGFLRYDELAIQANPVVSSQPDEVCLLPLSALDAEINHLMVYVQHLEPSTIAIPTALDQRIKVLPLADSGTMRTRLSQWLQGVLEEGWQTIETLINPEANLAWSTRQAALGAKGGKLINFGLQLGDQAIVLLVTVTPESEEKIGVNVQVLPAQGAQVLPAQLKLTLLSNVDKILQEVQSREQDNYIQLKPFKGKPGTGFSIKVSLHNIDVREAFEL
ncbi:MAG: DUF1822 family protein [Oculatellaceae cyanobacterium bins.114]|nr:DUF1822 family protein [Oculatellaceae cyanobacterium bins.114]